MMKVKGKRETCLHCGRARKVRGNMMRQPTGWYCKDIDGCRTANYRRQKGVVNATPRQAP